MGLTSFNQMRARQAERERLEAEREHAFIVSEVEEPVEVVVIEKIEPKPETVVAEIIETIIETPEVVISGTADKVTIIEVENPVISFDADLATFEGIRESDADKMQSSGRGRRRKE